MNNYMYCNKFIIFAFLMHVVSYLSFSQCPDGYEINGVDRAVNGDFSAGNTGFSSAYTYVANGAGQTELNPEAYYSVWTNPNDLHTNFSSCNDYSGDGNMMIINGAPTENVEVWRQPISVEQNTLYYFTTWISSVHPTSPAQLQFSVNGGLLGSIFTASSTTCNWQQFYATWTSGSATTANISLVNKNTVASGNDFAIDYVSFVPCRLIVNLPIQLIDFSAEEFNENKIKISWSTASETNNKFFTIERSTDAFNYDTLAYIPSKNINSNQMCNYEFVDDKPLNGTAYYRLKQTDYDGQSNYFAPVSVYFNQEDKGFKIYFDNQNYRMDLFGTEKGQKVQYVITDILGNYLMSEDIICTCNYVCCMIDLKGKLPTGIYNITWYTKNEKYTHKFIAH